MKVHYWDVTCDNKRYRAACGKKYPVAITRSWEETTCKACLGKRTVDISIEHLTNAKEIRAALKERRQRLYGAK